MAAVLVVVEQPPVTRVNRVPPEELSGRHLVAEYRELPRVFRLALAAWRRGERPDDPRNPRRYVLGEGHVRFFYSRLGYPRRRFLSLVREMKARGYRPAYTSVLHEYEPLPIHWRRDWEPDEEALALCRARIRERS